MPFGYPVGPPSTPPQLCTKAAWPWTVEQLRRALTAREGCAGVFDLTDQEMLEVVAGILVEDGELVEQTGAMLRRHISQLDEQLEYLAGRLKTQPGAEVSAMLLSIQGRLETMRADLVPGKPYTS